MLQPSTDTFIGGFQWRGFNDPMNFMANFLQKQLQHEPTALSQPGSLCTLKTGRVVSTKSDFCWSKNCPEKHTFSWQKEVNYPRVYIPFYLSSISKSQLSHINGKYIKMYLPPSKNKRSSFLSSSFRRYSYHFPNSEIPNQLTCPGHLWMDGIPAW